MVRLFPVTAVKTHVSVVAECRQTRDIPDEVSRANRAAYVTSGSDAKSPPAAGQPCRASSPAVSC